MTKVVQVFSVLLALLVASVSAFLPLQSSHGAVVGSPSTRTQFEKVVSLAKATDDDFPPEEQSSEYTGDVDWDAEWKKVVASGATSQIDRPGKDFYKSEAEIAAIKATNKAAERVVTVGDTMKSSIPDVQSLTKDWKFWVGILVVLSVATSLLSAPQMGSPPISNGDSYYI